MNQHKEQHRRNKPQKRGRKEGAKHKKGGERDWDLVLFCGRRSETTSTQRALSEKGERCWGNIRETQGHGKKRLLTAPARSGNYAVTRSKKKGAYPMKGRILRTLFSSPVGGNVHGEATDDGRQGGKRLLGFL